MIYEESIPTSETGLGKNYSPTVSKENVILNVSIDEQIIMKKLNVSPLESCLIWPNTPERKGFRVTE